VRATIVNTNHGVVSFNDQTHTANLLASDNGKTPSFVSILQDVHLNSRNVRNHGRLETA
jgi:hypothetical protein